MQDVNEEYSFLTYNHEDDRRTIRLSPEHWML